MPTPATTPITKLGLQIPSFSYPGVTPDRLFEAIADIAVRAERSGFDSIWVMDHFYQLPMVGPESLEMFDAYTLLAAIAARTSTARLGTMVTGVTYRNPAHLAKIVTGLDVISGGRAILGIGAAWNESEHMGYGFDFPPTVERFERLEEAVQICRAMFTEERPSFQGKHYRIERALNSPRPVTPGGPPVLIGGSGEKRTLNLVARYADACNLFGDAATVRHKLAVLDRHCETVGRDNAEITKTKLGQLLIAPPGGLEDVERRYMELRGLDRATMEAVTVRGEAAQVTETVGELMDAGLDGLIFSLPFVSEPEEIERAGALLAPLLAR
jgi:F420-dependent oxidoreductase-like protein